jgi:hypothetical protein
MTTTTSKQALKEVLMAGKQGVNKVSDNFAKPMTATADV